MVRKHQHNAKQAPPPGQETTTGTIIFITSIATHISTSVQHISCYTASKSAVRGLVKPLAMELVQYGIRVNSLSPGYMMTDMMRGLQKQLSETHYHLWVMCLLSS